VEHGGERAWHEVEHGGALGAHCAGDAVEQGLHHAGGKDLLAHLVEDAVQRLATAECVGGLGIGAFLAGDVDGDAADATVTAGFVQHGGGGEGHAHGGALGGAEPCVAALDLGGEAERVRPDGVVQENLTGAAEQGGCGPAEDDVRCGEGEAALDVGFEHDVGGDGGELAPALPAFEHGEAKGWFGFQAFGPVVRFFYDGAVKGFVAV